MNKVLVGILVGGALGLVDGATAWFTPAVRAAIVGIMIGSMIKGMIAGIAAGWFARKVQSVPAGIVFGLIVGALLAFLVCQLQGGKYYFEIMLPGSIVGLIVGWATQRYGRVPQRSAAAATMIVLGLIVAGNAHAAVTANDAFAKLKSLSGSYSGKANGMESHDAVVVYRVTSAGNTVMETFFPGSTHEMITMFTLDGDDVVATHYCAAGNQPTMKLNREKSTADKLVFDFVSVRGAHARDVPHIHSGWISITPDGINEEWQGAGAKGDPEPSPERFSLVRAK